MKTLILFQAAVTWALVGLIWTIQVVHYPLFENVGEAAFTDYHRDHNVRITWLVAPLMLVELALAGMLLVHRPPQIAFGVALAGALLVGVVWLSTAALQVPQHGVLASGFDASAHRFLVLSNWIRTGAWTARGVLMIWIVGKI